MAACTDREKRELTDYVGYRTQRRQSQQKKKRTLLHVVEIVVVLLIVFILLAAAFRVYPFNKAWDKVTAGFKWVGRKISGVFPKSKKATPTGFLEEGKKTGNYLVILTRQADDGSTLVSSAILASYDSRNKTGSLIYFPADMRLEVPGAGEDQLANLVQLDDGGAAKTIVAISNLMGVTIDRYVMATDHDSRIFLNAVSPNYDVEVTQNLKFNDPGLKANVNVKPGNQKLNTDVLAAYLTYAPDGNEMDLLDRQEGFATEFLKVSNSKSDNAVAIVKKSGDLFDTSASDNQLAGIWQAFSQLAVKSVAVKTVPLKEVKIEKTVVHIVDRTKLEEFKKQYVKSDYVLADRVRLDILNGCGTPGIGEKVASSLDPSKFQVVNNGNADNFNHDQTVIIIYNMNKKVADAAEEIKRKLEVGLIDTRPPDQNLLDITVIVGKDYSSK